VYICLSIYLLEIIMHFFFFFSNMHNTPGFAVWLIGSANVKYLDKLYISLLLNKLIYKKYINNVDLEYLNFHSPP